MQACTSFAPLTWRQIAILLVGRLALNTAFRIVYPLLTFLARGLAVDQTTASLLVTVQVGATLVSPLGGRMADTYGVLPVRARRGNHTDACLQAR